MIKENLSIVRKNIRRVCDGFGINPQDITLVGVTKFATAENIREAVAAGLDQIGENKVQHAKEKFPLLEEAGVSVKRHMIGHLQTNKVKAAVELFDVIQSVDSFKLAQEIEKCTAAAEKRINIFVQVNTSGELQKFGVYPPEVQKLIEQISRFENIRVRGLMTIAPLTEDKEVVRACFRKLRNIRDKLLETTVQLKHVDLQYLSMGMSDDYEIAIEEGANMVRIGRAIFK